ncbi:hypothetical protein GSI_01234 [Ganoderma sinense ZZ0214-1]|uniref:tRNA (guanine(9)-N1)-methyltransferase n=1 Tax=Ganoderma sinense ZZ0214-1 TaxID=1077348 RepID=A0A2G8SUV7_9APHY|nr:hypothetical protein GSI_01234 [Ganoderma sinense ZZ0214-1]
MSDGVSSDAPAPTADAPKLPPLHKSDAPDRTIETDPTAASTDADASTSAAEPLSKKAQKKLAKAAHIAERKKERRAAEKERKKEKRREYAQKRDAGELDADELEREGERKRQKTEGGSGRRTAFGARVVVDLGFDAKMTENEVKSLTSQLAYTYSANRKAAQQFSSLLFTSLDGRTKERMDGMNNAAYKRWAGAEWWEEGYERLWEGKEDSGEGTVEMKVEGEDWKECTEAGGGEGKETLVKRQIRQPSRAEKSTVVYLTADSEEELSELKEGETYILGGIVDHNRYKNLCLNKSKEHGIRSARLPIGTYLTEMRTRKVLTVNQTFEILLKWVETRDWEQALNSVMPKRKFNTECRRRGGAASSRDAESVLENGVVDGEGEEVDGGGDAEVVHVAELEGNVAEDRQEDVGSSVEKES